MFTAAYFAYFPGRVYCQCWQLATQSNGPDKDHLRC